MGYINKLHPNFITVYWIIREFITGTPTAPKFFLCHGQNMAHFMGNHEKHPWLSIDTELWPYGLMSINSVEKIKPWMVIDNAVDMWSWFNQVVQSMIDLWALHMLIKTPQNPGTQSPKRPERAKYGWLSFPNMIGLHPSPFGQFSKSDWIDPPKVAATSRQKIWWYTTGHHGLQS